MGKILFIEMMTYAILKPIIRPLYKLEKVLRKNFTILLFLFSLFICLVISSDVATQSNSKIEYVEVENLWLDESEVFTWCSSHDKSESGCHRNNLKINVFTATKYSEKSDLTYYYLVDGGIIIGEGKRVVWDLIRTRPGKYSITVGIGKDSDIKGNTVTKTVEIKECGHCDIPCNCPQISVSASTVPAKGGETLIFTAHLLGGTQDRPAFNWKVSDGEIVKIIQKEDESQILVKTSPTTKSKQITATVEVGGLCMPECERTVSATAQIKK